MLELQGSPFGSMRQAFGGDTLNTAVYLARCGRAHGLKTSYVTALGDDAFSDGLLARWAEEGIATQWVRRLPGRLPGLYAIEVDAHGERRFHYWRDSAAAKSLFDAPRTPFEESLAEVDLLYTSGISLAILPPEGRERLFAAMQAVRARGARVAFDSNFRARLWPDRAEARRCYARAFEIADLAFVSVDDVFALHGRADLDHVFALPPAELAVKQGAATTFVRLADSFVVEAPVQPVIPVDTTAAGDSFAGGYLALRLAGRSAAQAAAFANRLAARVVQHPGALIPADAMDDLVLEAAR